MADGLHELLQLEADDAARLEKERKSSVKQVSPSRMHHAPDEHQITVISIAESAVLSPDLQSRIDTSKYDKSNPAMRELMNTITSDDNGVLVPVLAIHDEDEKGNAIYRIIAGARRWHAVKYIAEEKGISLFDAKIPAYIHPRMTPDRVAIISMMENEGREDLTQIERAIWFSRFLRRNPDVKMNKTTLAETWGISRQHVYNAIALAEIIGSFASFEYSRDESGRSIITNLDAATEEAKKLLAAPLPLLNGLVSNKEIDLSAKQEMVARYMETGDQAALVIQKNSKIPHVPHVETNHGKVVLKVDPKGCCHRITLDITDSSGISKLLAEAEKLFKKETGEKPEE